jgi:hypothetical protein
MDGNIKTPDRNKLNPKVKQPGYSDEWYWTLIKETRTKFKVIEPAVAK